MPHSELGGESKSEERGLPGEPEDRIPGKLSVSEWRSPTMDWSEVASVRSSSHNPGGPAVVASKAAVDVARGEARGSVVRGVWKASHNHSGDGSSEEGGGAVDELPEATPGRGVTDRNRATCRISRSADR